MKMADNSLMTFQNNCESINRNGVEVKANHITDNNTNEDSTNLQIIVNKPNYQPRDDILQNSSDILTQGDVVDKFLAGEGNLEFNNDLLPNIDNDNEEISFKSENTISECNNEDLDKNGFPGCLIKEMENSVAPFHRTPSCDFVARSLKRRSIKCLNKMQIMEDVREGCNVQPSSPGHAEQRADDESKVKTETNSENGYEEQNSNTNHTEDNSEDQKEDVKPDNEVEVTESTKTESLETNNEENYNSNDSTPSVEGNKRKSDSEDFPIKRLRTEIHQNFLSRDKILNEFIEMAECNNLEQIHTFSEQLLAEIKTLNELAKDKEREWNNILHLKKIKEELLLRMQRKRQIMLINDKSDYADVLSESQNDNTDDRSKSGSPHSILKSNLTNPQKSALRIPSVNLNGDRSKHRTILPKLPQNTMEVNGSLDLRQGKQRPILDVQSIIADYRQRHPEAVPRRGRRIRNSQMEGSGKAGNNILNFSSMTLGSGSQVRQNLQGVDMNSEFGILLSSMNGNRSDFSKVSNSDSTSSTMQDTTSFRDMLLQFAKLSQSERTELMQNFKPPPPYPEVTVHPVPTTTAAPTNSLLHGILTKSPSKQNNKTSFSPTLARLLTAPERSVNPTTSTPTMSNNTGIHPSNMSISEILSTSKARNEITITPVGTQYEAAPTKVRTTDEEEAEDSADRLVIDESNETGEARRGTDNNSETGDEVPPCQGCNQKPAQFVCAGCGNQWYCSRDCQVSAWDEHSEVCSG